MVDAVYCEPDFTTTVWCEDATDATSTRCVTIDPAVTVPPKQQSTTKIVANDIPRSLRIWVIIPRDLFNAGSR